jgi:hypothetical protein
MSDFGTAWRVVALSAIVLSCILEYRAAARKKPDPLLTKRPSHIIYFTVPIDTDEAFKVVLRFAQLANLKVAAVDELLRVVVLDEGMSFFYWGYFYPVYISPRGDTTLIEVGVQPRTWQWGFHLRRKLKKMVNNIKLAFLTK